MPETSVERTQELELGDLASRWAAPATISPDWQFGAYRIKPLAQDQVLLELFQGREYDTYKALLISSKDVQSDIIPGSQSKVPSVATWAAIAREWKRRVALTWNLEEVRIEAEDSPHAHFVSGGPESDDAFDLAEESSEVWSPDRLADELLELSAENDWPRLRELVLLAEDTDFSIEQSSLLAPRLLEFATQYRDSNDSQDGPIVWSAIRTGASMLRPHEAKRLLPLLEPGHSIETSLVALKMLGHIFDAQPPERPDQHTDLASKVRGIAESLLNRYAIASSHQSAAMAQLAVYALAAMASSETETLNIVRSVRRLGMSWFVRQTARELGELRSYWDGRSSPVAPEVLELLERTTQELGTT